MLLKARTSPVRTGRFRTQLFELFIFSHRFLHGFRFKFFGVSIQSYEYAPACKQHTDRHDHGSSVHELPGIFACGLEGCDKALDGKCDNNDHQKPGQESAYAGRPTNMSISDHLFLGDGLCYLKSHDCRRKNAHCFNDLLGGGDINFADSS